MAVFALAAMILPASWGARAQAQEEPEERAIEWQVGPTKAELGEIAEIEVPENFAFAGADDTRFLLESMGNPTTGSELGLLSPTDGAWFVVFEFSDIGYVKDDEKEELDADAILGTLREGNELANEERERRGWPEFTLVGWERPPQYDPKTNNLEWAIRGESGDSVVVNYNTRLLGRRGVMEATLVVDPEGLNEQLAAFKGLLTHYSYKEGYRYAEFVSGDKIAKYGLAALVAGGAAAAAVKTGLFAKLFAKLWKVLVVVAIAIGSFFKKIVASFRRKSVATGHA
jgi:uncharacterized membrane-anchored protein